MSLRLGSRRQPFALLPQLADQARKAFSPDPHLERVRLDVDPLDQELDDPRLRRCPYREHALISQQEHEAWDVLLACQGHLRLAPSGHIVGIDMQAALELAAARNCDRTVLSELLPAAEAGMVEALCSDRVLDDGP